MDIPCRFCGKAIGLKHHSLDRRIQVIYFGEIDESISVLYADGDLVFCDIDCWHRHEPTVFKSLALRNSYPTLELISECCRCGGPVDRQIAHVSYAILDQSEEIKPWLTSCEVHSDEEFAVLCHRCDFPNFEATTAEIEENQDEVFSPPVELTNHTHRLK